MRQGGIKSLASLSIVAGEIKPPQRLPVPTDLTPEAAKIYKRMVDELPHDWFGGHDVSMLSAFANHLANADRLIKLANAVEIEESREAFQHWKELLQMHDKETRAAANIAMRMRLTAQSLLDNRVAGTKNEKLVETAVKPWQQTRAG